MGEIESDLASLRMVRPSQSDSDDVLGENTELKRILSHLQKKLAESEEKSVNFLTFERPQHKKYMMSIRGLITQVYSVVEQIILQAGDDNSGGTAPEGREVLQRLFAELHQKFLEWESFNSNSEMALVKIELPSSSSQEVQGTWRKAGGRPSKPSSSSSSATSLLEEMDTAFNDVFPTGEEDQRRRGIVIKEEDTQEEDTSSTETASEDEDEDFLPKPETSSMPGSSKCKPGTGKTSALPKLNPKSVNLKKQKKTDVKKLVFRCYIPFCTERFAFHAALKGHVQNFHNEEYSKGKFGCSLCGDTFPSLKELREHRRVQHE